jgi:G protein beta subunit-like protein
MPLTVILATAGYDHKIRYWDANTGACTRTTKYEESQVNALQISPNKYYLAAAGNPNIHLFDVNSASDVPVISFEGHTGNVTALGWGPDTQTLFSCSEDGSIRIWDLRAPEAQRVYECHGAVHSAILHPNQTTILSGDQNGFVKTWDILGGNNSRSDLQISQDGPVRSLSIVSQSVIHSVSLPFSQSVSQSTPCVNNPVLTFCLFVYSLLMGPL